MSEITTDTAISAGEKPFSFTGQGGEYFKIWIVNIFLTIITLGIYSAWATVRTRKYFYGNTRLMGSSFGYHAKPINILIGRVIAVVIYLIFVGIASIVPVIGFILALALLFAVPWILNRALRFNAFNSSYRNIRFNFKGTYGGAFMAFIIWPIIGVLSLYLLAPVAVKKQQEYIAKNHLYGRSHFSLMLSTGAVYAVFFIGLVIFIAVAVVTFFLTAGMQSALPELGSEAYRGIIAIYVAMPIWFLYNFVAMTNLTYNNLNLKENRFSSTMTLMSYAGLVIVNLILIVITLGLAIPWVKVRNARYKADKLALIASGNAQKFEQAETNNTSALGDEIGAIFDIGV